MADESFRFLHASDFHLERPLADLDELPDLLRDTILQAPRLAVSAIIDAAIVEEVDFVIFSGDLLHPQSAGPYGVSLLLEAFDRLNEAGTQVYWAAGLVDDPDLWPTAITLPDNVTVFPKSEAQSLTVRRAEQPLCRLVGRSCDGTAAVDVPSFKVAESNLCTIGVAYGQVTAETLSDCPFDYWALGGSHQRSVFEHPHGWVAAYSGTPQGRSLEEVGEHGFQIIEVGADRSMTVQHRNVDSFCYCRVSLSDDEVASMGGVENLIGDKIYRLQNEHGSQHLLIAWELELSDTERLGALNDLERVLNWARREYGAGDPAAWSLSLSLRPPDLYPRVWCEEETILGDFLRASAKYQNVETGSINLMPMIGQSPPLQAAITSRLVNLPESELSEALKNATRVGVEWLRGGVTDGRHLG